MRAILSAYLDGDLSPFYSELSAPLTDNTENNNAIVGASLASCMAQLSHAAPRIDVSSSGLHAPEVTITPRTIPVPSGAEDYWLIGVFEVQQLGKRFGWIGVTEWHGSTPAILPPLDAED